MSQSTYITNVSIEGLHDQFDVDLPFGPGLNILYGKNGTGKTTVLHLLANALELDFKRFAFLQFSTISINTSNGSNLTLTKAGQKVPLVTLNGRLYPSEQPFQLGDSAAHEFRDALGQRPIYLPAFRSVLERARTDGRAYYRGSERRDAEFEEITEREMLAVRGQLDESSQTPWLIRGVREDAEVVAQKTMMCRLWFGQFVPIVRYPSVADVSDGLTHEWQAAQFEASQKEQTLLEEILVKVFRAAAGIEQTTTIDDNDNLLSSIENLLKNKESYGDSTDASGVYDKLLSAARAPRSSENAKLQTSLLEIYRQVLVKRNDERKKAFQRTNDFAASVNKFLDRKTIQFTPARTRGAVVMTTQGGNSYPLTALSSGERHILTMLYSASRTKFVSGIFLIDEPELSLHIDWQRIILREIQRQASDHQIIACTHSPEVGADHMENTIEFEPNVARRRQESLFTEDEQDL